MRYAADVCGSIRMHVCMHTYARLKMRIMGTSGGQWLVTDVNPVIRSVLLT